MDRHDETDPEKTLIRPRTPDPDKTIIVARQGAAASKPTPVAPAETAPAAPPKPLPAIRVVAFGLAAFVFLGATAGLVTVYLMSGGTPEVSDESLNQQLVSVEPAETQGAQPEGAQPEVTEIAPPQIIGLSGDPITVQRRDAVSRKLTKLSNAAAAFVAPLGIGGEIYRLNDALSSADSALATGVPGSQQSYAFFASGEVEGEAPAQEESTVGDGADNTSTLAVNADMGAGPPPRLELAKRIDQDSPVSKALVDLGFTEQSAGEVERSFGEILHVQSLSKADAIAVRGFLASPADGKLNLGQISLYRDGKYLGTLALSDNGTYAAAEDPWYGQNMFAQTAPAPASVAKLRLLDSIYAAATRNGLPTAIAGEIILLLSRTYDLDQSADDDDKITILYASAARDPRTGFGRVLYVRIERSSGNVECYAFQLQPGAPFQCVSGDGTEVTVDGGMTMPVKGVITAKYGPREDPKTHQTKMNFGVDWAAPAGTPVVAALDGEVTFAGQNKDFGNFVKITHDAGRATGYAHLKEFASGIAAGTKVRAGQIIGYVGQTGDVQEPELHFEMYQEGQQVDPFGQYQATIEKGGAIETLVQRITVIESGNRCDARNPLSTAVGLGQFIESTWLRIIRDHRPDLMEGRSRAEILALRLVCDIAREMTTALARENAASIRSRGFAVTPGNLYLAHFLGPGGAVTALGAAPTASVGQVLGSGVVQANPFLAGWSTADLIAWAAKKMNQKVPVVTAGGAPTATKPVAPVVKYVENKAFLAMKMAVNTLLQ
jgi:murein DD-endopeptidase MepM/ murein hydrolase activator NlpD